MSSTSASTGSAEQNTTSDSKCGHTTSGTASSGQALLTLPAWGPYLRVLTVQSSVVYGYVGNKSAMVALQAHGLEADPMNSVQFSNHAAYKVFRGYRHTGEDLREIVSGLRANNFLSKYSDVLYGYMGSVGFMDAAVEFIKELKRVRPDLFFLCDPVLGDNRRLYVPASFVESYRNDLLPLADAVTPNQTELELLADCGHVSNLRQAVHAIRRIHTLGPKIVVVTSLDLDVDPTIAEENANFIGSYLIDARQISGATSEVKESSPENFTLEYDIRVDKRFSFETMRSLLLGTHDPSLLSQVEKLPEGDCEPISGPEVLVPTRPLHVLASVRQDGDSTEHCDLVYMQVPMYSQFISGSGDVVAAMLLARLRGELPSLIAKYASESSSGADGVRPELRALGDVVAGVMAGMNDLLRWTIASGRGELMIVQRRYALAAASSLNYGDSSESHTITHGPDTVVTKAMRAAKAALGADDSVSSGRPRFIRVPFADLQGSHDNKL